MAASGGNSHLRITDLGTLTGASQPAADYSAIRTGTVTLGALVAGSITFSASISASTVCAVSLKSGGLGAAIAFKTTLVPGTAGTLGDPGVGSVTITAVDGTDTPVAVTPTLNFALIG